MTASHRRLLCFVVAVVGCLLLTAAPLLYLGTEVWGWPLLGVSRGMALLGFVMFVGGGFVGIWDVFKKGKKVPDYAAGEAEGEVLLFASRMEEAQYDEAKELFAPALRERVSVEDLARIAGDDPWLVNYTEVSITSPAETLEDARVFRGSLTTNEGDATVEAHFSWDGEEWLLSNLVIAGNPLFG